MIGQIFRFVIIFFILLQCADVRAQGIFKKLSGEADTNYVVSYLDHLTTRLYASIKSAGITLGDEKNDKQIVYHPNEPLILGIGANYGILGLNIGFNFPFIKIRCLLY